MRAGGGAFDPGRDPDHGQQKFLQHVRRETEAGDRVHDGKTEDFREFAEGAEAGEVDGESEVEAMMKKGKKNLTKKKHNYCGIARYFYTFDY